MEKLGLVLAGGGGKGAYFIGVWKALKEFGVDKNIAAVSGTSVGALNAVLFANGNYMEAYDIWSNITSQDILTITPKKILSLLMRMGLPSVAIKTFGPVLMSSCLGGVFSREGLINIIESRVNLEKVSNSYLDIYACAYNVRKLDVDYIKMNYKTDEEIKNILLASSAIPVVFEKQNFNGQAYYDGGLKDNVPIKPLYDEGIRNFIVIYLSRDCMIDKLKFEGANIIEIMPREDQGSLLTGTLDFSEKGAIERINQGYKDAIRILDPIYKMGLVQHKIGDILLDFKKDNQEFKTKRREILNEREILKNEIENLLKR